MVAVSIYISTNSAREFPFLHILSTIFFIVFRFFFFFDGHSYQCEVIPIVGFIHISLIGRRTKQAFHQRRQTDRLQLARLLCPWNSPGKNIAVGNHSLLQGIFLTQRSNLGLQHQRQIFFFNHLSQEGRWYYILLRI